MNQSHGTCALRLTCVALLSAGLLWGCAAFQDVPPEKTERAPRGLTLVLPFIDMARTFGPNTSVRNPVTSKVFLTGTVSEDGAAWMTNELYRLVGKESGLIWGSFSGGESTPQYSGAGLDRTHVARLQELGRLKGAESVMAGYLYAFRERSGGAYGVEQPAQVVFELAMIRTGTGRPVWQRSFKETQKSLSEDLTRLGRFIKRKGRWVSAQEMASRALQEMLGTLPRSNQ